MKKSKTRIWLLVAAALSAWAGTAAGWWSDPQTEVVTGVEWEYIWDYENGDCVIVGVRPCVGELVVPASLGGHPVREIGRAFAECDGLRKVTIPDTVRMIGYEAFWGCRGLEEAVLPESLETIDNFAFSRCFSLTNVTLGKSIERIGWNAFEYCGLRSVCIPGNISGVAKKAFYGCDSLTNVTLGEGITVINDLAFSECGNLKSVTIPSSMSVIASCAFRGCHSLADVWFEGGPPRVEDSCVFEDIAPGARGHYRAEHAEEWAEEFGEYIDDWEDERDAEIEAYGWLWGARAASWAKESIQFDHTWHGLIMTGVESKWASRGGIVRLHRNAWSRDEGEAETVDVPFAFGETVQLPKNPFPGVARELFGWTPGAPSVAPTFRQNVDALYKDTLTLTEENLDWAKSQQVAETENGKPVLHLYGEWMTEVTVRFFTVCDLSFRRDTHRPADIHPLEPADLANHVFFRFAGEKPGTNHRHGETVALPPGRHDFQCSWDAAADEILQGWDAAGHPWEGKSIDISGKHDEESLLSGAANHDLEAELVLDVRLIPKGNACGFARVTWRGEATAAQRAACPQFPAFDGGKVTLRVVQAGENRRRWDWTHPPYLALEPGVETPLPPGKYAGHVEYADQTGTGVFKVPFWQPEGGTEFEFEVDSSGLCKDVVLTFRPFGRKEPCWRVAFDGNGGKAGFADMWYQDGGWKGGAPARPAGQAGWRRALPGATREGAWGFEGWFTDAEGGDKLAGMLPLEQLMDRQPANRVFFAHWSGDLTQAVTFDANGGRCGTEKAVFGIGQPYGELPTPEWAGHAPLGWFTRRAGGEAVTRESIVTSETTRELHAQWTDTQKLTIHAEDESNASRELEVRIGEWYSCLPEELHWQGHEFLGWFTERDGGERVTPESRVPPVAERELFARWKKEGSDAVASGAIPWENSPTPFSKTSPKQASSGEGARRTGDDTEKGNGTGSGENLPAGETAYGRSVREGALMGNAEAQNDYGLMWSMGTEVEKDDVEAVKWFRLSAEQGYAPGQLNLALAFAEGRGIPQNTQEAKRWAKAAAEQGLAKAETVMGALVMADDMDEAVSWFRRAAAQGEETAIKTLERLGVGFDEGTADDDEIPETADLPPKVRETLEGAKRGDAVSQWAMGVLYSAGEGVPKNDAEAAKWFRMAAEQGHSDAQYSLGLMCHEGSGVPQDDEEAAKWLLQAADQGMALAQSALGEFYARGIGVEQDDVQSAQWFQKAAEQGIPEAQFNLANRLYFGRGIPRDYQAAAGWYRKVAEKGHVRAQYNLGIMLLNGRGVPENEREAVEWFRKAAAQGHADAIEMLEELDTQSQPSTTEEVEESPEVAFKAGMPFQARYDAIKGETRNVPIGCRAGEEMMLALPGGVEMKMVWCPPGTFTMGSPDDEEGRNGECDMEGGKGNETQH